MYINIYLTFFIMSLPKEIQDIIFMYAITPIFQTYPTLKQEMMDALKKRHTYAHRIQRIKIIARLYIKNYEKDKIKNFYEYKPKYRPLLIC